MWARELLASATSGLVIADPMEEPVCSGGKFESEKVAVLSRSFVDQDEEETDNVRG